MASDTGWRPATLSVEVLQTLASRRPSLTIDAAVRAELGLQPRVRRNTALGKYGDGERSAQQSRG
jgi:hypothetical protein